MKIPLKKIDKSASFPCSGLSQEDPRDKNLIIWSSFGGKISSSLHTSGFICRGRISSKKPSWQLQVSLLLTGLIETPTQRFALETPSHLPHRIGYIQGNYFTGQEKALEVGKYVFVTNKYLLSICYLSTLIDVPKAKRETNSQKANNRVGQIGPKYQ